MSQDTEGGDPINIQNVSFTSYDTGSDLVSPPGSSFSCPGLDQSQEDVDKIASSEVNVSLPLESLSIYVPAAI